MGFPGNSERTKELWQNPEYRQHMVEVHKGYKWTESQRENYSLAKQGFNHTEESIKKMILAKKGKESPFKGKTYEEIGRGPSKVGGSNHYKWLGGYSKSQHKGTEYNEWRMSVYKRDNFKCKMSNEDCSGKIEAHHILSFTKFPELRYEINNGITLCQAHHPRKRAEEARLAPVFQDMVFAIAN